MSRDFYHFLLWLLNLGSQKVLSHPKVLISMISSSSLRFFFKLKKKAFCFNLFHLVSLLLLLWGSGFNLIFFQMSQCYLLTSLSFFTWFEILFYYILIAIYAWEFSGFCIQFHWSSYPLPVFSFKKKFFKIKVFYCVLLYARIKLSLPSFFRFFSLYYLFFCINFSITILTFVTNFLPNNYNFLLTYVIKYDIKLCQKQ